MYIYIYTYIHIERDTYVRGRLSSPPIYIYIYIQVADKGLRKWVKQTQAYEVDRELEWLACWVSKRTRTTTE